MRKSLAIRGMLATAAAALTLPAAAITGTNWVEDNEHPFVGLIVFYDAAGEFVQRCSGSLISPTKFLTAGPLHRCERRRRQRAGLLQQNAGANYDPATQVDPVSGYPETCAPGTLGITCSTSTRLYNYGFANFAGFPNTKDVGLVILKEPITLPEYGVLPLAGTLDGLDTARGNKNTSFTISGYGLTKAATRNRRYRTSRSASG
jgi:hypothetical protein